VGTKKPTIEELTVIGDKRRANTALLFKHIDCDNIKFVNEECLHWYKKYPTMICGGIHVGLKWLLMRTPHGQDLYIEQNDEILLKDESCLNG